MSPLRLRMYILACGMLAGGLLALGILTARQAGQERSTARRDFTREQQAIGAIVEQRLRDARSIEAFVTNLLREEPQHLQDICRLVTVREEAQRASRISVFTRGGAVLCASTPGPMHSPDVVRGREYFRGALATGTAHFEGPFASAGSGPILVYGFPIAWEGEPSGVVAISFNATAMLDLATRPGDSVVILDGHDRAFTTAAISGDLVPDVHLTPDLLGSLQQARRSAQPATFEDGKTAWAFAVIPGTEHVLALTRPQKALYAAADAGIRDGVRLMGAYALLAVAVVVFVELSFIRRWLVVQKIARTPTPPWFQFPYRDEVDVIAEWARETKARSGWLEQRLTALESQDGHTQRALLLTLAQAVESRYPQLRNHGERTAQYVRAVGERLGLQREELDGLEFAAVVHDVGKLIVSDAVYLKPGALDPAEWSQMRLHATRGEEIIAQMHRLPRDVAMAVRHHHEHWDGGGYPDRLQGEGIPLWARIIAVCDAYDSMTEPRPYRPARPHEEALAILQQGAGRQWDPGLVAIFVQVLMAGVAPEKETVSLATPSAQPLRPI